MMCVSETRIHAIPAHLQCNMYCEGVWFTRNSVDQLCKRKKTKTTIESLNGATGACEQGV